jgi:predicted secreted protein
MSMLLAALLISANPAVAQQPAAAAPARVQPAKPAKEKKICKADPTETGSHMVQRICMTQEEWDHRGRNVDEFNSTIGGVSH